MILDEPSEGALSRHMTFAAVSFLEKSIMILRT